MKVSVTQENLAKALGHVIRATANKPNIPVLANIHISTERGKVKFASTDLDISISVWIGGDIAQEGEITVNSKLLTEFVNQLKSSRVELLQSGQSLEIKSVDNQAQLVIIPADDFPSLPNAEREADLIIPALELRESILKTSFAAATDQSRPILTGLLLESTQRRMSLVGVDGFRLSKKTLKLEKGATDDLKQVIPARAWLELAKIISDVAEDSDNVSMFLLEDKNQVVFKINEVVVTSRILEGNFPDYHQIIPSEKQFEFNVDKRELADSVKIASIFARSVVGNKTFFKVDEAEKQLSLSAKVMDLGNNESKVDLKDIDGGDYETAFNARFLADMIGATTGDEIRFESNGVTAPGVFRDSDDEDFLHIIMPMRIE